MVKLGRVLLTFAAAWGLLIWLCHGGLTVTQPYQVEYGEGHMLGLAYYLGRGQPIYSPGSAPPYVYGAHLPLYLWLTSLFLGSTPSFLAARLISFTSILTVLLASAAWLWKRQGPVSACAGVGFLLLHPLLLGWSPLARVDNLGFCFSVLAVLLARPRWSLPLCLLALFTKQSFVAAPLALAAELGARRGIRFLAAYAVSAAVLLATVNQAFFQGRLPLMNNLVTDLPAGWHLWTTFGPTIFLLALLAGLCPLREPESRRLAWYSLASLLPVAAAAKQGAYYNYFLELHWALSMLAALALSRRPGKWTATLAALQLGVGATSHFPILESPVDYWRYETTACLAGREPHWVTRMRGYDQLREVLAAHPGPVLAEQCGNPLLFGREPIVCDCYALFFDLARAGAWDPTPILEMLRRREISVVLIQRLDQSNLRVPVPILECILENYEVIGHIGKAGDYILVPKQAAKSSQPRP
ncbi:hypothetical protein ABS71_11410 [bacterium SCN 62-11]|nr:hypothetical protein [Candidatus Eremiobacteraeota bacterium]ODT67130.1 MAG: hypothetical protein ABS71_11410 [bacterium SCN 62-11]